MKLIVTPRNGYAYLDDESTPEKMRHGFVATVWSAPGQNAFSIAQEMARRWNAAEEHPSLEAVKSFEWRDISATWGYSVRMARHCSVPRLRSTIPGVA